MEIEINKKFIDELVLNLHKKGYNAAYIGLHLRDNYLLKNIEKLTRLYPFLKATADQIERTQVKQEKLITHSKLHKHDYKSKRCLVRLKPKIHKLKQTLNKVKK